MVIALVSGLQTCFFLRQSNSIPKSKPCIPIASNAANIIGLAAIGPPLPGEKFYLCLPF